MAPPVNPSAPAHEEPAQSLAERAYIAIRDMVVTLSIPAGAPINEEQLTRHLGLGRTPVREAIKRLEAERLVAIYPRRGTFAADINITDLVLISEVRHQLEGHAAFRAAQRANRGDREELRRLLQRMARPPKDDAALMRLDTEVHRAVYRCTHNPYLEATLTQYYNLVLRIWYLFIDQLPHVAEHVAQHRPLLEAIVGGKSDQARVLAEEHVADFERTVRAVI
jgi:DNA-binding GntR family transcriptional regulator